MSGKRTMIDHADNLDMFPNVEGDVLEHLDPEILKKWPQGLSDMLTVIESTHRRAGDEPKVARERAFRAVRALATFHGGRTFYVPQGRQLDRALRDREIWARHTGHNVAELSQAYHLTEVQIYSILAEQRKLARARYQSDLFDECPGEG